MLQRFEGLEGLARRVQCLPDISADNVSVGKPETLVVFGDRRQPQMLPTALLEEISGEVLIVQALHDHDDRIGLLVVEALHDILVEPGI